nr:60S ribosomal protein L23a-like [Mirounga angustirostris]
MYFCLALSSKPQSRKPLPKAKAKAKALKAKKVVWKSIHSQRKKICRSPAFQQQLRLQPKYPWKGAPRRNKSDHHAIIKSLNHEEIEDNNTLVSIVDVKANMRQIKQAVKKLMTLMWPRSTP